MIRTVNENDADRIAEINNDYILHTTISFDTATITAEEMRKRIRSIAATHPYFVLELDGQVEGYCYAHPWKERAAYSKTWETTIYLSEAAQGKGYGTELMNRLIDESRRLGAHVLIACITAENTGSERFHIGLGFKQVSHFQQVGMKFGRWLDVDDFQLTL